MQKLLAIAIVMSVIAGCKGTTKTPAPLSFPPASEHRLRYRFAVPPPGSIEKHPFTLYGRKTQVQKRIIRAINAYGRVSTCVTIPRKEAGNLARKLKYAGKKGADFLLLTNITVFNGSFKGRNARIIPAYMLGATIFGLIPAWDVNAKTWLGEGTMEIKIIECSSGKQIYSSAVRAEALYNFGKHDEMMERDFGKNYIRYTLGDIVLNNLMVGLVEDLNRNFLQSLVGPQEEAPVKTPTAITQKGEASSANQ